VKHSKRDYMADLALFGLIILIIASDCTAMSSGIDVGERPTNPNIFYAGINLAGAEFGLYDESEVRMIMLCISLRKANILNYYNNTLEYEIAIGRWDAGISVVNSNKFDVSATNGPEKFEFIYKDNLTSLRSGMEIQLSTDDELPIGPLPGRYGLDYIYPTQAEINYFAGKGMNAFRLPFRWERMQPDLYGDLNSAELSRMDSFISHATKNGAYVILDPHNFGRYIDGDARFDIKNLHNDGRVIGGDLPSAALSDFWERLAFYYKENTFVIFGIMNEPHNLSTKALVAASNEAIDAIRSTGARNLILVPGNDWTSAERWYRSIDGASNAESMLEIADPMNNYAFEVHQYLFDSSGNEESICEDPKAGSEKLKDFTSWLRQYGKRGFLGEFAVGSNDICYAALDDMLMFIRDNSDVWLGWTYWAAGPWWPEDYVFNIGPDKYGNDRPQMTILSRYLPR
jgi:endoglucanase